MSVKTHNTDQGASVRGGDDVELARRLGAAVREAMGELTQSEVARNSRIDQPTLSKLVRGVRLTPMTVWEMLTIEKACNRPAGWILSRAGYSAERPSATEAIMGEDDLPILARRMLIAALEAARGAEAPRTTTMIVEPKTIPVGSVSADLSAEQVAAFARALLSTAASLTAAVEDE